MAGKGTRHRFELSRLEIAGVLVSATAGLFVVFLLGIYAGRGLAERHLDLGQQIVRLPVAPAAEQTPGAEDSLTFYDTLGGEARVAKADARAGGERPVVVPPAEEAGIAPPVHEHAKPVDTAPVAKPAEPLPTAQSERADKGDAVAKAEPPVVAPKHEPMQPAAPPTPALAKAEHAPAPPSTARVAVALAPPAMPTPVPRTGMKGNWSVQVSATRDPRTADDVLRRLKAKGYDAFVLKVRRRGETFYRVRVGHYASLEEAQQLVSRLRREPGVPEAFVASD
jgi:DedD protein